MSGTAGESPVDISYVKKYFVPPETGLNTENAEAKECLAQHMPTVLTTLISLLGVLLVSWLCGCRYMGGGPYLAAKACTLTSGTMFVVGAISAGVGLNMEEEDASDPVKVRKMLMDMLIGQGIVLIVTSILGYLGTIMSVKGGVRAKMGKLLLLLFRIAVAIGLLLVVILTAATTWYYGEMEKRVDKDWDKLVTKYGHTDSWQMIKDKGGFQDREEFSDTVRSGFKIVIIAGVVIIIILVFAFIGASFLAKSKAILVDIEEESSDDEHVVGGSTGGGIKRSKDGDSDSDDGKKEKKKKKKKKNKKGDEEELIGDADASDAAMDLLGTEAEPDEEELRLKQMWETLDSDGSGLLSQEEARIVFGAMGKPMSEKQTAKAFTQMDASGNGEIEFEELLTWWRKQKKKAKKALEEELANGAEAALAADGAVVDDPDGGPAELDAEEAQLEQVRAHFSQVLFSLRILIFPRIFLRLLTMCSSMHRFRSVTRWPHRCGLRSTSMAPGISISRRRCRCSSRWASSRARRSSPRSSKRLTRSAEPTV
jgi:hypothetical protein